MIYSIGDLKPDIDSSAYVSDEATIIGNVEVGATSSIWFGSVIRGDNDIIRIGANTSIQEGTVIHTDAGFPMSIGNNVTVGHRAVLHGCDIDDLTLIGINSVVLNGAKIGAYCLIGANSMVTSNKVIPDRSLVMGSPARVVREVTEEECEGIRQAAEIYCRKAALYRTSLKAV